MQVATPIIKSRFRRYFIFVLAAWCSGRLQAVAARGNGFSNGDDAMRIFRLYRTNVSVGQVAGEPFSE